MGLTRDQVKEHITRIEARITHEKEKKQHGYEFAKLYYQVKDYPNAIKYLTSYLSVSGRDHRAQKLMGRLYDAVGDYLKSVAHFKRSLDLKKGQRDVIEAVASVYCKLDNPPVDSLKDCLERVKGISRTHPLIIPLSEKIQAIEGGSSMVEVISTALATNPGDVSLHIQLVKLHLASGELHEAFTHCCSVRKKGELRDSLEWQQCALSVVEDYYEYLRSKGEMDSGLVLGTLISVLEFISDLFDTLTQPKHNSLSDCAALLLKFDKVLCACGHSLKNVLPTASVSVALKEMCGRVYYMAGCYLYLAAQRLPRSIAGSPTADSIMRLGVMCFLCSLRAPPPPPDQVWTHSEDTLQMVHSWHSAACARTSIAGHHLAILSKTKGKHFFETLPKIISDEGDKLYFLKTLFGERTEKLQVKFGSKSIQFNRQESFLAKDDKFLSQPPDLPDPQTLKHYDRVCIATERELASVVWRCLAYRAMDKHPPVFSWMVGMFDGLQQDAHLLNNPEPDTLCVYDLEAFLILLSDVYSKHLTSPSLQLCSVPSSPVTSKILSTALSTCLPSFLNMLPEHTRYWTTLIHFFRGNLSVQDIGSVKRRVREFLNFVRGLSPLQLNLQQLTLLARHFRDRAEKEVKFVVSESDRDLVMALLKWGSHYWTIIVNFLMETSVGDTPSDTVHSDLLTEARMALANVALYRQDTTKALCIYSRVKTAHSAWNQSQIYLHLADTVAVPDTDEKVDARLDHLQKASDTLDLAIARLSPTVNGSLRKKIEKQRSEVENLLGEAKKSSLACALHFDDDSPLIPRRFSTPFQQNASNTPLRVEEVKSPNAGMNTSRDQQDIATLASQIKVLQSELNSLKSRCMLSPVQHVRQNLSPSNPAYPPGQSPSPMRQLPAQPSPVQRLGTPPSAGLSHHHGTSPPTGLSQGAPPYAGLSHGISPPAVGLSQGALPLGGLSQRTPPTVGWSQGTSPPAGLSQGARPPTGLSQRAPPAIGWSQGLSPPTGLSQRALPTASFYGQDSPKHHTLPSADQGQQQHKFQSHPQALVPQIPFSAPPPAGQSPSPGLYLPPHLNSHSFVPPGLGIPGQRPPLFAGVSSARSSLLPIATSSTQSALPFSNDQSVNVFGSLSHTGVQATAPSFTLPASLQTQPLASHSPGISLGDGLVIVSTQSKDKDTTAITFPPKTSSLAPKSDVSTIFAKSESLPEKPPFTFSSTMPFKFGQSGPAGSTQSSGPTGSFNFTFSGSTVSQGLKLFSGGNTVPSGPLITTSTSVLPFSSQAVRISPVISSSATLSGSVATSLQLSFSQASKPPKTTISANTGFPILSSLLSSQSKDSPATKSDFTNANISSDFESSDEHNQDKDESHDTSDRGLDFAIVSLSEVDRLQTGEEDEDALFTHRAKLYRFDKGEWKEKGIGDMKILKHRLSGKVRLLMRRDQILKLCCNHYLVPGMSLHYVKDSSQMLCWFTNADFSDGESKAEKFAIKFKTDESAAKFKKSFEYVIAEQGECSKSKKESNFSVQTSDTSSNQSVPDIKSSFQSSSISSLPEEKLFSGDLLARFAPPSDSWACDICMINNDKSATQCIACSAKKPGSLVKRPAKAASDFQSRFAPPVDSWECDTCMVNNEKSSVQCVACSAKKPGLVPSASSTGGFKLPTGTGFTGAGFKVGQLFSQASGPSTSITPTGGFKFSLPSSQSSTSAPLNTSSFCTASSTGGFSLQTLSFPSVTSSTDKHTGGFNLNISSLQLSSSTGFKLMPMSLDASSVAQATSPQSISSTSVISTTCRHPSIQPCITTSSLATAFSETFTSSFATAFSGTFTSSFATAFSGTSTSSLATAFSGTSKLNFSSESLLTATASTSISTGRSEFTSVVPSCTTATTLLSSGGLQLGQVPFTTYNFTSSSVVSTSNTVTNSSSSSIVMSSTEKFKVGSGPLATTTATKAEDNPGVFFKPLITLPDTADSTASKSEQDSLENDPGVYFKPLVTLPDTAELETGEEGTEVLFTSQAKLFRFDSSQWKERGEGDIKLLKCPGKDKVRVVMRREQIKKICCNHYLTPSMSLSPMANSEKAWIWYTLNDFADGVSKPEQFAVRFKNVETAQQFKNAFQSAVINLTSEFSDKDSSSDTSVDQTTSKEDLTGEEVTFEEDSLKVETSDEKVVIVSEEMPSPEKIELAKRFRLPLTFFNYETKQPCSGCRGCVDESLDSNLPHKETSKDVSLSSQDQNATLSGDNHATLSSDNQCTTVLSKEQSITMSKESQGTAASNEEQITSSKTSRNTTVLKEDQSTILLSQKQSTAISSQDQSPLVQKSVASTFMFGGGGGMASFSDLASNKESFWFDSEAQKKSSTFSHAGEVLFSAKVNDNGDDDSETETEVYFKPLVSLSDIELKTGEESDETLFSCRAKLFRFDPNVKQWKERGIGDIKITRNVNTNKFRILMRRDQIRKLCCNHYITPAMDLTPNQGSDRSWVWYTSCDFSEGETNPEKLAVRFKHSETAADFKRVFDTCKENSITHTSNQKEGNSRESSSLISEMSMLQRLAPPAGSWTCPVCLVTNTPGDDKCAACENLREKSCPPTGTTNQDTVGPLSPSSSHRNPLLQFPLNMSPVTTLPYICPKPLPALEKEKPKKVSAKFTAKLEPTPSGTSTDQQQNVDFSEVSETNNDEAAILKIKTCARTGVESLVDDVIFLYEDLPENDLIEKAKALMLPPSFFLYEKNTPCPGCRGCTDESSIKDLSTSADLVEDPTSKDDEMKDNQYAPTIANVSTSFKFSAKPGMLSFSDLTSDTTDGFAKPTPGFHFHNAGKQLFSVTSADDNADPEAEADISFRPIVTLGEAASIRSWDDDADTLFVARAKLFRFCEKEWKERGVGDIKIMRHRESHRSRIIMRREQILKLCCNHYITADMKLVPGNNDRSWVWFTHSDFTEEQPQPEKLAVRFKTSETAAQFKKVFENCVSDDGTRDDKSSAVH